MRGKKAKELRRYLSMKKLNGQSFKTVYRRAKKQLMLIEREGKK